MENFWLTFLCELKFRGHWNLLVKMLKKFIAAVPHSYAGQTDVYCEMKLCNNSNLLTNLWKVLLRNFLFHHRKRVIQNFPINFPRLSLVKNLKFCQQERVKNIFWTICKILLVFSLPYKKKRTVIFPKSYVHSGEKKKGVTIMFWTLNIHINDGELICIPFTTARRFNHR